MSTSMNFLKSTKKFWTILGVSSAIGATTFIIAKTIINQRKIQKFNPVGSAYEDEDQPYNEDYSNSAFIKPGFPAPNPEISASRKSEYEGTGTSYMSRKQGDRFSTGFFK